MTIIIRIDLVLKLLTRDVFEFRTLHCYLSKRVLRAKFRI